MEFTSPSPERILLGLAEIANDWRWLAALWHGCFAALVLTLVIGLRPSRRMIGILLVLPLVSVSILAWTHANPFNGASFALAAVALLVTAGRFSREAVEIAPARVAVPGALLIGFGWVYPHFLQNASPLDYLYAAPTGLIPCPTLSIVIGFTLVLGGLGSRSWCLVLAIMGLFYGIFGAVRLGVGIDWILALGALGMTYVAACGFRRRHNATWLVR